MGRGPADSNKQIVDAEDTPPKRFLGSGVVPITKWQCPAGFGALEEAGCEADCEAFQASVVQGVSPRPKAKSFLVTARPAAYSHKNQEKFSLLTFVTVIGHSYTQAGTFSVYFV